MLENSGESPIILKECIEEYTSNEWKQQNRKMSTCNHQLDLESLGSWPASMPKNSRAPMIRENRQLVTDEPVDFEK